MLYSTIVINILRTQFCNFVAGVYFKKKCHHTVHKFENIKLKFILISTFTILLCYKCIGSIYLLLYYLCVWVVFKTNIFYINLQFWPFIIICDTIIDFKTAEIPSTNKAKYNVFSLITKINYNIQSRFLLTKTGFFFFFFVILCATPDVFQYF